MVARVKRFLDNSFFKILVMMALLAITISTFQTQTNGIQYLFLGLFILYTGSLMFKRFFHGLLYLLALMLYEIVIAMLILQFENILQLTLLATFIPLTISALFVNELLMDKFNVTTKRLLLSISINAFVVLSLLLFTYLTKTVNSFIYIVFYFLIEIVLGVILATTKKALK